MKNTPFVPSKPFVLSSEPALSGVEGKHERLVHAPGPDSGQASSAWLWRSARRERGFSGDQAPLTHVRAA